MNFKDLLEQEKIALHEEIVSCADHLGGQNFLLQLIEDLKDQEQTPLTSKEQKFSFSKGFIKWNKVIYKESYDLLLNTIITQEQKGDPFSECTQKEKKRRINMFKALKPVVLTIKPKNHKDGEGFSVNIVEHHSDDSVEVSLMFRILFFHNIAFAKQALSYGKH